MLGISDARDFASGKNASLSVNSRNGELIKQLTTKIPAHVESSDCEATEEYGRGYVPTMPSVGHDRRYVRTSVRRRKVAAPEDYDSIYSKLVKQIPQAAKEREVIRNSRVNDLNKLAKEIPQSLREHENDRYGMVNYYANQMMLPKDKRKTEDLASFADQVCCYAENIDKVKEQWGTNDTASVAAFLQASQGWHPETLEEVTFLRSADPKYLDAERKVMKNNPYACAYTFDFHTLQLGSIEFIREKKVEKYPALLPVERYIYQNRKELCDSPFSYPSHPKGGLNVVVRHKDATGNPHHWKGHVNTRLTLINLLARGAEFNLDRRIEHALLLTLTSVKDEASFTCVSQEDERILSDFNSRSAPSAPPSP